jgi:hypothetical protein
MKRLCLLSFILIVSLALIMPSTTMAQEKKVRKSLMASVMQRLGVDTDITIVYSRPGVKGRKIWGELVPYGMNPGNDYSDNKPYPWRAGANENTTIEFSKAVLIEGNKLPAGKYGLHMIPKKKEWTIIFSKNSEGWGSFGYKKEEDALRIKVTPEEAQHKEWLTYKFTKLAGTSATCWLHWEKIKVPFKIALPE